MRKHCPEIPTFPGSLCKLEMARRGEDQDEEVYFNSWEAKGKRVVGDKNSLLVQTLAGLL